MFAAAALVAATLAASALPAMAASPADSIVFFPIGTNGATYSCTGGPPFVHDHDDSSGNCAVQHVGAPTGLVCDVPTTITLVHDMHQLVGNARLCRGSADAASPA
jgi:hypothetical protein